MTEPITTRSSRARAWLVHAFTASGAVLGLLALIAAGRGEIRASLAWMLLAVVVDGLDGTLARRFRVRQVLPEVDGTLLDNLVDYLTYTVVPSYLLYTCGPLSRTPALVAAAAIVFSSAFQFAHSESKTADHLFTGFPSYWNVVVFYLLLTWPPPWIALPLVLLLSVLCFAPLRFVYPTRTVVFRRLTLSLLGIWGAAVLILLLELPKRRPWLVYGSLLFVAYYAILSLWLTTRRKTLRGESAR